MKRRNVIGYGLTALSAVALLAVSSCSSNSSSQTGTMNSGADSSTLPDIRGRVAIDAVTETARVQSINPADRTVVLQYSDGTTESYACGAEVRNFDQVKVGDQVNATVAESVAVILVPGGIPPAAGTTSAIVRAPLGDKPAAKRVDTVGFTAKVVSVDVANRKVTLQTMDGINQTVKVGPDVNLAGVNPGDTVGVRVTRAFAISVTSPNLP